jgi:transcriptional regulator of met regulon
MKRTQLYIDDEEFKTLKRISKERAVTVSELVRDAIRKAYTGQKPADAEMILREAAGLWKDRKDLRSADEYVRTMRKDTRRERLGLKS